MPSREQWAHCYIKQYRNFKARVTSPTKSSNLNVKSYLLNGKSDVYRLVTALSEMYTQQQKSYTKRLAFKGTRTRQEYLNRAYLGNLPLRVSYKYLELINHQYRHAKAAIPTNARQATELNPYGSNCTTSLQFGVPYRHSIYTILKDNGSLKLGDVHPH